MFRARRRCRAVWARDGDLINVAIEQTGGSPSRCSSEFVDSMTLCRRCLNSPTTLSATAYHLRDQQVHGCSTASVTDADPAYFATHRRQPTASSSLRRSLITGPCSAVTSCGQTCRTLGSLSASSCSLKVVYMRLPLQRVESKAARMHGYSASPRPFSASRVLPRCPLEA